MRSGKISIGHPVDVSTGIMFETYEDVVLPGRLSLSWKRQYSTALLISDPGLLGQGWSTPYSCRLTRYPGGFHLLGPEGDLQEFDDPAGAIGDGGILRSLGTFQDLRRDGSRYVLTRWSASGGSALRFLFPEIAGSPMPLASIENFNGGAVDFFYDAANRLVRLEQRRERRALELEYDSSGLLVLVNVVTASRKRYSAVEYEYDLQRRLTSVRAVTGHPERYVYDPGGRIVREIRRDGGVFSFGYDAEGRCIRTSGLDHYDEKSFRYHDRANWTEVTDSLANVWRYEWNASGQVVRSLSPRGAVTTREYDEYGRIRAATDPRGGKTEFIFDERGDRSGIRLPDGREWNCRFDTQHQFLEITTPAGTVWNFEYDQRGRIEHITHPAGLEWHHVWRGEDMVITRNSNGGVWHYDWDEFGQLRRAVTTAGATVKREYNELGFCTAVLDSRHGDSRFEWNLAGRLLRSTNAAGISSTLIYDASGNLTRVGNEVAGMTTYRYGRCCGQLLEEVSPSGAVVKYKWSTEPNRLDAIVDPNGNEHIFEYNEDGYLVRELFPSGRTLLYNRNVAGDVDHRTNGAGETTRYERDICGRVLAAEFFDGSRADFKYDINGKLIGAINDSGKLSFQRDVHGRRTVEEFGKYTIESAYDSSGHRTNRESSMGAQTSYEFDEYGRLLKLKVSPTAVLELEYDSAGREVRRLLPGDTVLAQSFDRTGRLLSQNVAPSPSASRYKPQSGDLISRKYRYDFVGRLSEVVDVSGVSSSYSYGPAGHLEAHDAAGLRESFKYDLNGNISFSERSSILSLNQVSNVEERREIGPGDRLAQVGNTSYIYDSDDRLIAKAEELPGGGKRRWKYEWNALGLLGAVFTPSGEKWTYSYDALGRRIRKQSTGVDIRYVWDGNAILHEIDHISGRLATWTFSPRNFIPLAYQENGNLAFPVTDSLGTPREFVSATGRIVWSARYSAFGEVEHLTAREINNPLRFPGQWFDAETGLHYNNLRYYDPKLGRYISMDPVPLLGGLNGYAYGPDPINWIDPFGLAPEYYPVDGQNRPTGAFADLSKNDLRPTDTSPPTIDPPGWQGGEHPYHQQRSHLVADTFGGSGDDPRNLVTLTDGSNHPGMSEQEGKIRNYLKNNPDGRVLMEVTAEYDGENPRPTAVRMYALNENGEVLVDERVENGRRQKLKSNCCATT
ncbi:MAG TPA: RHS repeat-associated core domain-containing protein [Bryobacteraceae bacterium]|nr:RHS repeat-associated core domain-containing protein [Bryobacteraceae bacterium]